MRLPKLRIAHLEPKYPIVQGGMGVKVSTAPLAAAVANQGGIGTLSAAEYHHKNRKTAKTDTVRGITVSRPFLYAHELAAEIKRQAPSVKVLYTSGYDLSVLGSQGYAVEQLDAFLSKPFVPAILANVVRKLLT